MSAIGNKIRSASKSAKLWATLFVVYVFAREGIGAWQLYDATHSALRGFVVNDETYYVGHADPVLQQRETHIRLAKTAAIAMYGRNPYGLDQTETLTRIFSTPCQKLILQHVGDDAGTFASSSMSQDFKPDRPIIEVARDNTSCTMLVEGDVVQVRVEHGVSIPDSKPMRLVFRLERNARFGEDGKFPMVVTKFTADYIKEHSPETHTVADTK
jgi:hypothetical protein